MGAKTMTRISIKMIKTTKKIMTRMEKTERIMTKMVKIMMAKTKITARTMKIMKKTAKTAKTMAKMTRTTTRTTKMMTKILLIHLVVVLISGASLVKNKPIDDHFKSPNLQQSTQKSENVNTAHIY